MDFKKIKFSRKSIFLFIVLTFLFANNRTAKSQTWIEQGAVWHYAFWVFGGQGVEKIEYESDTVIAGITCQKLTATRYIQTGWDSGNVYPGMGGITYSNGDTVFYFVNGAFHMLYNFGALPGDTWDLGIDTNSFGCSSSIVKVDSVGTIMINSQSYRWISLSPDSNSSVGLFGKYVERFGQFREALFPVSDIGHLFPVILSCDGAVFEYFYYTFTCFEDDSLPLFMNPLFDNCQSPWVGINERNISNVHFNIYPSPASDFIIVENEDEKNTTISVIDLCGKIVLTKQNENSEKIKFDISSLAPGMYFITATKEGSKIQLKKFVKF